MSMTWKSNPKDRIGFGVILDIFMVNCKEEKRKQLGNTKKRSCASLNSNNNNSYQKKSSSHVTKSGNHSIGKYKSGTRSLTNSVPSSANSSAASAITVHGNSAPSRDSITRQPLDEFSIDSQGNIPQLQSLYAQVMKHSGENESDTEDAKKSGAKASSATLQCSLGTNEKIVYKMIRPKNQSSDGSPNGIESSSNAPFDQDDEMNETRALKHYDSGYAEKSEAKKDVIGTDFQEMDAKEGDANYILPSEIEFTTQV